MKRLRASEGDSGAAGPGAVADPNALNSTTTPTVGAGGSVPASLKAALSEKAPDSQTATMFAAAQEEQPQGRCNGDVVHMLPQRKAD